MSSPQDNIKTDVLEISNALSKNLSVENGKVTVDPEVYLVQAELAGISKENITDVQKFNATFTAAMGHAVGTAANDLFKKNKEIDTVTASTPMCKDKCEVTVNRTKEVSGGMKSDGTVADRKVVNNALTIKHRAFGGSEHKHVKAFVTGLADKVSK